MFRMADDYAYDTSIKPIENVPIVSGATAYDHTDSGKTFILVFNESLYYGDFLDQILINPNQVRAFGLPFWDNPYDTARSLSIDVDADLHIPLRAHCTKLMFRTRVPTEEELLTCDHIQMMSSHPWNPTKISMLQATNQGGNVSCPPWKQQVAAVNSTYKRYEYLDLVSHDAWLDLIDPSLVSLGERLSEFRRRSCAQVETIYNHTKIPARRTFVSDERHTKVTAEALADKFGISVPRAQRTLRVTTQRGVRSAIIPIC